MVGVSYILIFVTYISLILKEIIRIPFSSNPNSIRQNNCEFGYVGAYINNNHYVVVDFVDK
jgi:hypothetical protein